MNAAVAVISSALIAFAVTGALGFVIIPWLMHLTFGKSVIGIIGTTEKPSPTMGGIMPIVGVVSAISVVVLTDKLMGGDIVADGSYVPQEMYTKLFGGVVMAVAFAFIGFIDDYSKIINCNNLGMKVKQKSLLQIIAAVAYLVSLYMGMQGAPYMFIPFAGAYETGFFHWIFGIIFIYCMVNSVSHTENIDGLCSGISLTSSVSLAVIAGLKGLFGFTLSAAALAGACAGFLLWNKFPARVKIGSTGAMFIGGMLVAISYSIGSPVILLISCLGYVVEGLSTVVQIVYFKSTDGKLLLKAAPLHEHLKINGQSDKKIALIFTVINIIGGILAVAVMYFGGYIV